MEIILRGEKLLQKMTIIVRTQRLLINGLMIFPETRNMMRQQQSGGKNGECQA